MKGVRVSLQWKTHAMLCMQFKAAVLNTDNEEADVVTMETSEDTEACKVVLVTLWMRGFKLKVMF